MSPSRIKERSAAYTLQTAVVPAFGASFDLLATAPQGVAKLRELILSLALRGKLTRQIAEGSECSSAPQENRGGRDGRKLVDSEQRNDPLTAPAERDTRSKLPLGWLFTGLGEVVEVLDSLRKPVTKIDRRPGPYPYYGASGVVDYVSAYLFDEPLVLVGEDGAKWGMGENTAFLIAGKCWVNNHAHVLRPIRSVLLDRFLVHSLNAMDLGPFITGMTVPKLNQAKLRSVMLALPPIDEQARVVARVEELMQLCDALEAHGRLQDEQHARLVATLFDALATSASAEELAENWQRIATHFDPLLDRPEAVDALEQTLLQLAVRGMLVPQDPADEPATELLARIRAEKDQLVAGGQIKRDKLAEIGDEEKELPELPRGWEWASVASIAIVGTGTTPSRTNPAYFSPAAIPWVTSGETGQPFIAKTEQAVSLLALRETNLTVYPSGTLIVAMYGQGKTRGQVSELLIEATTNQACAAIVPVISDAEHRRYLKLFFEKIYDEIRELSAGGAQPNLNVGKVKATLIPLPPLAEQHRIVARVEQLRRLCAGLRERLQQARTTQSRLADALVVQAGQSQAGRAHGDLPPIGVPRIRRKSVG